MGWARMPKRQGAWAVQPASCNWRYLTEEDRVGPRKDEMMTNTTHAKQQFAPFLTTQDLCHIEGYRHRGARSTLTLYYLKDLVAHVVRRVGQDRFDSETKYGRETSGINAKERAEKEREEREEAEKRADRQAAAAQIAADQLPHAVVPAERLMNLKKEKLQQILTRCEGGFQPPLETAKYKMIDRIIRAGYSIEREAEVMAKQKVLDDALAARKAAEAAILREKFEKRQAKNAEAAVIRAKRKQERARRYAAGELTIEELDKSELKQECKLLGMQLNAYSRLEWLQLIALVREARAAATTAMPAEPKTEQPGPTAPSAPPTTAPTAPSAPPTTAPTAPSAPPPPLPPSTAAKAMAAEAKIAAPTTPATEVPASKPAAKPSQMGSAEAVGEKRKQLPKALADNTAKGEKTKQRNAEASAAKGQTSLMAFFQKSN